MNKKSEGIVTYIKDGVQETVVLNRWNRKKVFNQIFSQRGLVYYLDINSDITYLEMKNVLFSDYAINFKCMNDDTIVIFDNCQFRGKVSMKYGSFQLKHPTFNEEEAEIHATNLYDLDINYFDLTEKKLSIDVMNVDNFSFDSNGCSINNIDLKNVYRINLKNVNMNVEDAGQNFYFNNLNEESRLVAKNCNLNVYVGIVSNLELKNTSFYSGNELGLSLNFDNLTGSDYSFSTIGDEISLNDIKFYNYSDDELTFTDKDFIQGNVQFSRSNFVVFLGKLRDEAIKQNHQYAALLEKQMMKRKIKNLKK